MRAARKISCAWGCWLNAAVVSRRKRGRRAVWGLYGSRVGLFVKARLSERQPALCCTPPHKLRRQPLNAVSARLQLAGPRSPLQQQRLTKKGATTRTTAGVCIRYLGSSVAASLEPHMPFYQSVGLVAVFLSKTTRRLWLTIPGMQVYHLLRSSQNPDTPTPNPRHTPATHSAL
jgi:hypothetical protein